MANGFGTSPFILQNAFPEPGVVLNQAIENKRQDEQIAAQDAYRRQKDAEADQWRKLNLIQDLTNLDKHQTGSDVANAVGHQQASQILQKYTQLAPGMSPNELMAKVQQEMSGLISGMDAMKNELEISDEQLKLLKANFPGLDVARLAKDSRTDIIGRRLQNNQFVNPLSVTQSQIDYSNPEFLADYMVGNKAISDEIINAKGAEDVSVLMGKQGDFTTFKGRLPYWKTFGHDPTKVNSEGFYTGTDMPSFKMKESTLSSNSLPSSNGVPFKMVETDVFKRISQDKTMGLELIAATKKQFPTYATFTPEEKEYAQRNVLHGIISSLDQSQMHPVSNTRPQITRINNYNGSSKKEATEWDLTEYNVVPDNGNGEGRDITQPFSGFKVTAINGETMLAKKVVFHPSTKKFTVTEYLGRDADGNLIGETTKTISAKTFRQNIENMNPGADMKNFDALVNKNKGANSQPQSTSTSQKTYSYNGKTVTRDQVEKAAKQSNMTVDEYVKKFGLK
jgi:hypothetical protein